MEQRFQHRVLYWGILGALVMRGAMIAAGTALITRFHWVIYIFGAFLVYTGVKMLLHKDVEIHPEHNPVFRWASYEMAKIAQATLDRTGITVDDLDVFVPHQANMRIIDAMARAMKLPEKVRIARDIAEQGNTSAASIPLALDRMMLEGEARSGDTALLIAFGAGLAYAAQVVTVP